MDNHLLKDLNSLAEQEAIKYLQNPIKKFDRDYIVATISRMLLEPQFQANTFRLELLVFTAIAHCNGEKIPTRQTLTHWLNSSLGNYSSSMEDPIEDVFVANVLTSRGEYLVLPGTWEAIDSVLNLIFELIETTGKKMQKEWLKPCYAILALSSHVIKRRGLSRWCLEESTPKVPIAVSKDVSTDHYRHSVIFSPEDLNALGIEQNDLSAFVINDDLDNLKSQNLATSIFFEKPLLRSKTGEFIVTLPTSLAYAVKRYILKSAHNSGQLSILNRFIFDNVINNTLTAIQTCSHRHSLDHIELPTAVQSTNNSFVSVIIKSAEYNFLHFLFIKDKTEHLIRADNFAYIEFGDSESDKIHDHCVFVEKYTADEYNVNFFYTILIIGHFGLGVSLNLPKYKKSLLIDSIRFADLILFLSDPEYPVEHLITMLIKKESLKNSGLELLETNGLLNTFNFWKAQNYDFLPHYIPHSQAGLVRIGTDFISELRQRMRLYKDSHIEYDTDGNPIRVDRFLVNSFFANQRSLPIYASIEHAKRGKLLACFKFSEGTIWYSVTTNKDNEYSVKLGYDLWMGLVGVIYNMFSVIDADLCNKMKGIEIALKINLSRDINDSDLIRKKIDLQIKKENYKNIYEININDDLIPFFYGENNDAEIMIINKIVNVILDSYSHAIPDEEMFLNHCKKIVNSNGKVAHVLKTYDAIEHLLSTDDKKIYTLPKIQLTIEHNSIFRWRDSIDKDKKYSRDESIKLLNDGVYNIAENIKKLLNKYDGTSLIKNFVHDNETLLRSKWRWRTTARAVIGLHGESEGHSTALEVEGERARASVVLRALTEAAICESPIEGGKIADGYIIDELVGKMSALIDAGASSDAIYFNLAQENLTIHPNGSYSLGEENLQNLCAAYRRDAFYWIYNHASEQYKFVSYERIESDKPPKPTTILEFERVFALEYNISIEDYTKIYLSICEMALNKNAVVVLFSKSDLIAECEKHNIANESIDTFLDVFSLKKRDSWYAGDGMAPRDIQPWRYGRKISVTFKPILQMNTRPYITYIVGIGQLEASYHHLVSGFLDGHLNQSFCNTEEAKRFLGARTNELGNAFTKQVGEAFTKLGWQVWTERKMTQLGAPKKPNLGDIDVIAFSPLGMLFIIECKRLKEAKTIAEIAQTCSSFRGNEGDRLQKHMRRFEWVKNNIQLLAKKLNIESVHEKLLYSPLICSASVPFRYLEGLPISPRDIFVLSELGNYIRQIEANLHNFCTNSHQSK